MGGNMSKRKILSMIIVLLCAAAGGSAVLAQGRYARVYSRAQVDAFVQQLETSSDAFFVDFRREVNNSRLNNSTRRRYIDDAEQFENAVDRLRNRFNSNDSWWESRNEVQTMIRDSQDLNSTMNTAAFRRRLERQWNRLRNDVNRLADTYDLPGLNGGGWTGGGGGGGFPGGGGNVPNWAVGTFYGRNPNTGGTITMVVHQNGNVQIDFGGSGAPMYAALNNRTLRVGSTVSRVSRINNGIRTTRTDNGEIIDYFRGGLGDPVPGPDPGDIGGNVPNWALGTFYARNPQTGGVITLVVSANGSVTVRFGNSSPSYATLNGTRFNYQGTESRVSRINNGIRTTRLDNGEVIDYYRNLR